MAKWKLSDVLCPHLYSKCHKTTWRVSRLAGGPVEGHQTTPACDSQFENNPGHPHATVNKKIVLDNRVRQWIRKYSLTPSWTVNLKILLDICVTVTFCPQLVFPIGKLEQDKCVWNDYSLYVMSTVSNSVKQCQQCQQCQQFQQCQQCQQCQQL